MSVNPQILIVDDDESFREFVCMAVEKHGYDTVQAADGEEALEIFNESLDPHKQQIDAIITDFSMPKVDGAELIHDLRKRHEQLPILLMSSGIPERILLDLLLYERFVALKKPFSTVKLMRGLRHVLASNLIPIDLQKRRAARVPIHIDCEIQGLGEAKIKNLSTGGAFLVPSQPEKHKLDLNSVISIEFEYHASQRHQLKIEADVRWKNNEGMGIRFLSLLDHHLHGIHDILSHQVGLRQLGWFEESAA